MSLEKATISWSSKQLKGMILNGKVNFDHIVQRSYVWEKERKSRLIESMILGYPIPPIYTKRIDDGTGQRGGNIYYIMDGKQRLSTVKEFLNDEFELTQLPDVSFTNNETGEEEVVNISGLKFSELPEGLRDYLNTVMFNITYFDNLTKEEERELFKRLNAGKPLSIKNKVLASCKELEMLLNIGEHPIFESMFSQKSLENKNQVSVIMKIWCMLYMPIEQVSFETKIFNPLLERVEISSEQEMEIRRLLDVANIIKDTLQKENKKIARWFMKETHFVSIIPYIKWALEDEKNVNDICDFITEFYESVYTNGSNSDATEYINASNSGSAKTSNIIKRHFILQSSYLK